MQLNITPQGVTVMEVHLPVKTLKGLLLLACGAIALAAAATLANKLGNKPTVNDDGSPNLGDLG